MRKIGCWPMGFVILAILMGGLSLYVASWPEEWLVSEVATPLPMNNAIVRVQTWAGWSGDHPYILVIDTPSGSIKQKLWEEWGPPTSLNLYRTSDDNLIAIGVNGAICIELTGDSAPRSISCQIKSTADSDNWIYLGVIGPGYQGRFVSSAEADECINLYGQDPFPFREKHQSLHGCYYQKNNNGRLERVKEWNR